MEIYSYQIFDAKDFDEELRPQNILTAYHLVGKEKAIYQFRDGRTKILNGPAIEEQYRNIKDGNRRGNYTSENKEVASEICSFNFDSKLDDIISPVELRELNSSRDVAFQKVLSDKYN